MPFSFRVRSISIAHACVLDEQHKCAYPQGRGAYGVVLATEGEAEYRFRGGGRRTVRAGEIFLLPPEAAYSVFIPCVFRHYTVNFDIYPESEIPAPLQEGQCMLFAAHPAHAALFSKIASHWSSTEAGREMGAMACLYEILSLLPASLGKEGASLRLRPAARYLSSHFLEKITNAALSALCNMSETNFRREWMRAYGKTPLVYRDALRIEQAKRLLLRADLSVGEVARECGFEDESYFGRFFKKHAGETPGGFRRRSAIL